MGFVGDLGGVLDLIIISLSIFVTPYNSHQYIISIMEGIYKVKSVENIFEKEKVSN